MATPELDAARAARARIVAHAEEAERQVLAAYVRAWRATADELERAIADAAERLPDMADPTTNWRLRRVRRLAAALDELEAAADVAAAEARDAVLVRTPRAVLLGSQAPLEVSAVAHRALWLPQQSDLAAIVARATERITADFGRLPAYVRRVIAETLTQGVAAGLGTEDVARRMRDNARGALGRGLDRSRVIARTELLDASRFATRATYLANPDVVVGWRWMASLGPRCCPACVAKHGTLHGPEETLDGHAQCRCTSVPVLAGEEDADLGLGTGDSYVAGLDRPAQLRILGPARLRAYEEGVPVSAMAVRRDNPGWRPAWVVRPVKDLPLPARAVA